MRLVCTLAFLATTAFANENCASLSAKVSLQLAPNGDIVNVTVTDSPNYRVFNPQNHNGDHGALNLAMLEGNRNNIPTVIKIEREIVKPVNIEPNVESMHKALRLAESVGGPRVIEVGIARSSNGDLHLFSEMEDLRTPTSMGTVKSIRNKPDILRFIEPSKMLNGSDLETALANFYVRCVENGVMSTRDDDWMIDRKGLRPFDVAGYSELKLERAHLYAHTIVLVAEALGVSVKLQGGDSKMQANVSNKMLRIVKEKLESTSRPTAITHAVVQAIKRLRAD